MAPFVLKFKGNKSFSPFSNLADGDALTKTWKVCTKVAAHLEQGQRLENLSWRMWHLQNLMVEGDNAKSRREFKKLSKNMGERLDKDKGRSIEELEAPDFKGDKFRKAGTGAGAGANGKGGQVLKGMTFTFPADPVTNRTPGALTSTTTNATNTTKTKRPLPRGGEDVVMGNTTTSSGGVLAIDTNFTGGPIGGENVATPTSYQTQTQEETTTSHKVVNRTHYRNHADSISSISSEVYNARFAPPPSPPTTNSFHNPPPSQPGVIHFPNLFDPGFGPIALLCPTPSVKPSQSYGEAIGFTGLASSSAHESDFSVVRPTFEYPLDDLAMSDGDDTTSAMTNSVSSLSIPTPLSSNSVTNFGELRIQGGGGDAMQGVVVQQPAKDTNNGGGGHVMIQVDTDLDGDELSLAPRGKSPPLVPNQSAPSSPTGTFPPASLNTTPTPNPFAVPAPPTAPRQTPPHHRRRYSTTNAPPPESKKGKHHVGSATAPRNMRGSLGGGGAGGGAGGNAGNGAPGGVKSECANCGANSTPLWRRGLNDELNCNACGLFAKLHKRPRPKSLRNTTGEGGTRNPGWATARAGEEAGEPVVSCYNCATVATPLWRKDEDGRTLCNACGLYLKLHGEKRPSSMKSDVIRKRSRHDGRGSTSGAGGGGRGTSSSVTPSASPGASRRTSTSPPLPTTNVDGSNNSATSPSVQLTNFQDYTAQPQQQQQQQPGMGGNQDNSPVDLMSMSHSMVTDSGVDPALGGMTFSPGLTYTETLQYPGPVSLNYFFSNQFTQDHQNNTNAASSSSSNANPVPTSTNTNPPPADQQQQQQQHSPTSNSTSPIDGTPFGPQLPGGDASGMSPWDQSFQMPFNPGFPSFAYADGLGVVHPPMLPYWYGGGGADLSGMSGGAGVVPKTEPEHDTITFGGAGQH